MGLFKMPPIPLRPELTAPDPVTVEKRQPRKVVMFPSAQDDRQSSLLHLGYEEALRGLQHKRSSRAGRQLIAI